jgi:PAS domain S-box-containing protein
VSNIESLDRRLQREKDRFEAVFDESFDAMAVVDDEGRFMDVNQRVSELIGVSKENLLGRSVGEFVSDPSWRGFGEPGQHQGTLSILREDGTERTVEYTLSPDVVSGQHLLVVRDITRRKTREKELEEYETIVESLDDAVYVLNKEGEFRYVNDAFAELVGYDKEEILGSHVSLVKGEEGVSKGERRLGRILSDDGPDSTKFEIDIRTRDGEKIPCEDRMSVLPYEGEQFRGSAGVVRDISERKERERELTETNHRLGTVLETVNAAIFIKDADGRYQLMNQQCREMLGIGHDEDIVGLTDQDVFPEEAVERIRSDDRRALENGETVEVEESIPTPEGTKTLLTLKSPFFDDERNLSGVCAVSVEITD